MGLAVLLVAGAALALDIQCQPGSNVAGKECLGTDDRDTMTGTEGNDDIRGLGDDDVVRGLRGVDALEGDDQEVSLSRQGDDQVFADDGQRDEIDCGRGTRDEVHHDAGIDEIKNCKVKDAS